MLNPFTVETGLKGYVETLGTGLPVVRMRGGDTVPDTETYAAVNLEAPNLPAGNLFECNCSVIVLTPLAQIETETDLTECVARHQAAAAAVFAGFPSRKSPTDPTYLAAANALRTALESADADYHAEGFAPVDINSGQTEAHFIEELPLILGLRIGDD